LYSNPTEKLGIKAVNNPNGERNKLWSKDRVE
jgi:hypothetical protein